MKSAEMFYAVPERFVQNDLQALLKTLHALSDMLNDLNETLYCSHEMLNEFHGNLNSYTKRSSHRTLFWFISTYQGL